MTDEFKDARNAPEQDAYLSGGATRPQGLLFRNGWYVLPSRGAVVTNKLIDKIQEELDREEVRAAECGSCDGHVE